MLGIAAAAAAGGMSPSRVMGGVQAVGKMLDFGQEEEDLKSRHHCTDIPCLIVFIVALVAFAPFYIWCISQGDVARLFHGIDYRGRICGVDPYVANEPYLYWCSSSSAQGALSLDLADPICVSSCPGASQPSSSMTPFFGMQPGCAFVSGLEGMSAYRTVVMLGRYCIPHSSFTDYQSLVSQISGKEMGGHTKKLMRSVSSIPSAWPALLAAFMISLVVGYLYLLFLRHCAEVLIWISMGMCIVAFGWFGIFLWTHSKNLDTNGVDVGGTIGLEDNEQAAKIAALISWSLAVIVALVACCLRHSVAAASACIEVACDEMFEMPSMLLLPMYKSIVKGLLVLVLIYGFLKLVSTAEISTYGGNGITRDFHFTDQQYVLLVYYMFMSFWLLAFSTAVYQFTVAFAVAEYYFTEYDHEQVKDVGCCAVWDGLHIGLGCHAGSLAYGSLLIALLQTIQKILEFAEKQNKEVQNKVLDCILACAMACVGCCKEFVEFVNRNAYIDMAITSESFCDSARNALSMMVQLGGAMTILNGATFVFSVFGTSLITLSSGAFTYWLATSCSAFSDSRSSLFIDSPVTAMAVSMLIGLYVALCFMDLLDMASDTLLFCYGVDIQDGKLGHTAPPALKDLVHSGEHGDGPGWRH
uniref:Choline transporter-like protein n=1 Tax=Alexandrium catenella TaxID=2925 RepID=A0A7S1PS63_ALECA|mmetsp:Transcript_107703/g.286699  ORF Transcript_107703/g.286699 Transcript_107703/m.286699 type:complete len:641 (+) Transcript_107703:84-2006(+)